MVAGLLRPRQPRLPLLLLLLPHDGADVKHAPLVHRLPPAARLQEGERDVGQLWEACGSRCPTAQAAIKQRVVAIGGAPEIVRLVLLLRRHPGVPCQLPVVKHLQRLPHLVLQAGVGRGGSGEVARLRAPCGQASREKRWRQSPQAGRPRALWNPTGSSRRSEVGKNWCRANAPTAAHSMQRMLVFHRLQPQTTAHSQPLPSPHLAAVALDQQLPHAAVGDRDGGQPAAPAAPQLLVVLGRAAQVVGGGKGLQNRMDGANNLRQEPSGIHSRASRTAQGWSAVGCRRSFP